MGTTSESVLLYITDERLHSELLGLIDELNQPNREYTAPYGLSDIIQRSPAPLQTQIGSTLEQIITLHHAWAMDEGISPKTNENASLFLVADEESLAAARPRIVKIVHLSLSYPNQYEILRSPINQAIGAYTTIDGGQHGWEEFMQSAQKNDGMLPSLTRSEENAPPAPADQTAKPINRTVLSVKLRT
ncbi:hypothetical protein M422DRAFT_779163 [Sphaerobolus stellatus SS14]|uniref:Uncharacterized protein n=1 Tax=Sphaerobolus stellatus (strain SS14) TaxID=990650 RepID=A0A0C9W191_SPHS4|nr:hypothetical protein M422DRAFT_779163 [Sphaerobolus stellatus SS14]